MADTKISALVAAASAAGANELPINEAGTSKKLTVTQLLAFMEANIDAITSAGNFVVTLGDASGANELSVKDSAASTVISLDSDGNISAVTYGGIAEADLLDKSAAETISGDWVFSGVVDAGGATSVEIPNGAGGTTVNATGEVCVDSTSKTINFYDGAAEKVLQPETSKAITVESPTSAEDISMFWTDYAITVTKMTCVMVGSSPSVTWTVRHHTDRNNAGNEIVTGGTTTTSTTTGSVVTSFNDATIPADSFVWLESTAQSGTVTNMNLTILYTQDP